MLYVDLREDLNDICICKPMSYNPWNINLLYYIRIKHIVSLNHKCALFHVENHYRVTLSMNYILRVSILY